MKALRFTWAVIKYLWNGDDRYFFPDNADTRLRYNKEIPMTAKITPTADGGAALTDKTGLIIKTYSRTRDARRGAARLGLTIV